MANNEDINSLTAHLFRENSGKMVSVLTRIFGLNQIDSVMDTVHDTFEAAVTQWRYGGVPENPAGWLMQVAKNKAINKFKRDRKTVSIPSSSFIEDAGTAFEMQADHLFLPHEVEDSQLRMLLTCCHPEFSEKNQVILSLHILCGFGIAEIANALLMKEDAVKKALSRSKAALQQMGHILHTPSLLQYEERIRVVQTILYLMFSEGHKTTKADLLINNDLCYEAIRLTKLLLKPGTALNTESNALLALMFFNLSRFPSRLGPDGEILSLEEQDRGKWNKVFIEEGYYYLNEATKENRLSKYHLEAIIASLHCAATSFESTDWEKIVYLYRQMELIAPSPMVSLNRIVAESYLDKDGTLEQLHELKATSVLQSHYLLYAAEGDVLKRTGRPEQAITAFLRAQEFAASPMAKQFLQKKINQCNFSNN